MEQNEEQPVVNLCGDCNPEEGTPVDGVPVTTHCENCGLRK